MYSRCIALMVVLLMAAGSFLAAQTAPAANVRPISQQGITEALRIGGLTTQELVDIVNQRGVAFPMTEQVEADLRAAGAETPLIEAVRAGYRPPAGAPPPVKLGPLSPNEIITLLNVGTSAQRIAQLVEQRGVLFPLTPAITNDLTSAGADPGLLTAIEAAWKRSAANAPPPAEAAAAPPPAPPVKLSSMKQVHKLFIDKLKNNMEQYLRAEFTRQLPGRFQLVMNKDEADALLVGTSEEKTDTATVFTGRYLGLNDTARAAVSIVDKAGTVLWASEAGDRSVLLSPLKRGGPREVASRLVQELRKSLDAEE